MNDRLERGLAVMRSTFGEERFAKRSNGVNDFNRRHRELADEFCFGEVWAGPNLSPKIRSMLVMCMLIAQGRSVQLRGHIDGALNNGVTVEELQEVLLQVDAYCGFSAGSEFTRVAEEVLRSRGMLE